MKPTAKNTSVTLGQHLNTFVSSQIEEGEYANTSEAVRAGLRLLEERATRLKELRLAVNKGLNSGIADDYSLSGLIDELDHEAKSDV